MQSLWRAEVAPHRGHAPLNDAAIVARLSRLRETGRLGRAVHVVPYPDNLEDLAHVRYYAAWLKRAGIEAVDCALRDLDVSTDGRLLHRGRIVRAMIRMYPWELMFRDPGARHLRDCGCNFLNPPWVSLLSNKALLSELWRRHPHHPLLLRAETSPAGMPAYAEKPIHGRGGENVRLVREGGEVAVRSGTYGDYPRIYQALADQRIDGVVASVGAWIVGDAFAGVTMRESADAIIHHASPIVPHCVDRTPLSGRPAVIGRWFGRRAASV